MKAKRLLKLIIAPIKMAYAYLYPVSYAISVGVNCNSSIRIYGTSYYMFGAEPYLVTFGQNVHISRDASFICHDGATLPFRKDIPDLELAGEIKVGSNVFIGKGAVVLANVSIGNDCIVGAHAVVTKDVDDGNVVAGNPAKVIKTTEKYLEDAQRRSLKIGHLTGKDKMIAYKKIFNKE